MDKSEVVSVVQYDVNGRWIVNAELYRMGFKFRIAYTDSEPPDIDYEKEMPHKKWPSTKYVARKVDAESHDEKWKDIPGYEGYYQISNEGRVKSIERTVDAGNRKYRVQEKILTNQEAVNKHFVRLTVNGISESIMIEKTVKELFMEESHDRHIRPFKTHNVRPLVNQLVGEEINLSRFIELLNEIANTH